MYKKLVLLMVIFNAIACMHNKQSLTDHHFGIVKNVTKVADRNIMPKEETEKGINDGIIVGAMTGLSVGTIFTAATFGFGVVMIPSFILGGVLIGGASGGVEGYIKDYYKAGSGTYEYEIVRESDKKELSVIQIDKEPFEINDRVIICYIPEKGLKIIKYKVPKENVSSFLINS